MRHSTPLIKDASECLPRLADRNKELIPQVGDAALACSLITHAETGL
jgi:hypothetical protein